MYFKCNNFLLASFPISLKFVRLIPEKVLDILRDKSSYWYGYRKSCLPKFVTFHLFLCRFAIFLAKFFYFLHFKFLSHLGYFIPNGLLHLYPFWAIGPNLFMVLIWQFFIFLLALLIQPMRSSWSLTEYYDPFNSWSKL